VALFKHGDLEGAVTKLSEAHSKGPHWADPLKGWGDVLAKQGKTSEAIAKYDEALQFAPNWKELIAAREALRKTKS
jgi:Flp pilus assembly protein TadD